MYYKKSVINLLTKSILLLAFAFTFTACNNTSNQDTMGTSTKILFLHHSTGNNIWRGGNSSLVYRVMNKARMNPKSEVEKWFTAFNSENRTSYAIKEQNFPKAIHDCQHN